MAFNILLRRAQMLAVYHYVTTSRLFQSSMQDFETLTAKDFVTAALAAGECYTVRDALRKRNIDVKVKSVLKQMHIATRNVEATPAERAATRFKFLAMRIWNGCSFVFFPGWEADGNGGTAGLCSPGERDLFDCHLGCFWPAQVPDQMNHAPDWTSSCASAQKDWRKIDLIFP